MVYYIFIFIYIYTYKYTHIYIYINNMCVINIPYRNKEIPSLIRKPQSISHSTRSHSLITKTKW